MTDAPAGRPSPTLRVGVIGLGRACTSFLPSLVKHPRVRITAGADPRPEARARWAAEFGAAVYEHGAELCASAAVDAVYIATPHALHAPLAIAAAAHGKHAIVEKPMAMTLADCDAMIAAVERAGTRLVVGHSHGFDPPILAMREIIRRRELGPPRMIHTFNYKNFVYIPLRPDELDPAQGGGVIWNQAPHQVDSVRWLGGGLVRSVRAAAAVFDAARPIDGAFMAFLDFADGVAATLVFNGYGRFDSDEFHDWIGEGGMPKPPDSHAAGLRAVRGLSRADEAALKAATGYGGSQQRRTEPAAGGARHHPHFGVTVVSCERGELRPSPDGVYIYDHAGRRDVAVPLGLAAKSKTVDELYAAVADDRPVAHDGRWGKATLEVCLAIEQSARERREVLLAHQVPTPDA